MTRVHSLRPHVIELHHVVRILVATIRAGHVFELAQVRGLLTPYSAVLEEILRLVDSIVVPSSLTKALLTPRMQLSCRPHRKLAQRLLSVALRAFLFRFFPIHRSSLRGLTWYRREDSNLQLMASETTDSSVGLRRHNDRSWECWDLHPVGTQWHLIYSQSRNTLPSTLPWGDR